MKGLNVSDTFWTLILALFLSVMVIMGVFVWLQITLPFISTADPVSYSIEFLQIGNKPFLLAEVLSHTAFEDRKLFEQSIEIIATSLENSQSAKLPEDLKSYMKNHNLRDFRISIGRGNDVLMSVENTAFKCGDDVNNPEGWCVFGTTSSCGVGRIQINPTELKCNAWQKCCKEDSTTGNGYAIQTCGPRGEGICSTGTRPFYAPLYELGWQTYYRYSCEENRRDLGNLPECKTANNGNTRACCAPLETVEEIVQGITNKVTVPLLYKNLAFGTLEVTAK